jgi:hypothetical protein
MPIIGGQGTPKAPKPKKPKPPTKPVEVTIKKNPNANTAENAARNKTKSDAANFVGPVAPEAAFGKKVLKQRSKDSYGPVTPKEWKASGGDPGYGRRAPKLEKKMSGGTQLEQNATPKTKGNAVTGTSSYTGGSASKGGTIAKGGGGGGGGGFDSGGSRFGNYGSPWTGAGSLSSGVSKSDDSGQRSTFDGLFSGTSEGDDGSYNIGDNYRRPPASFDVGGAAGQAGGQTGGSTNPLASNSSVTEQTKGQTLEDVVSGNKKGRRLKRERQSE